MQWTDKLEQMRPSERRGVRQKDNFKWRVLFSDEVEIVNTDILE